MDNFYFEICCGAFLFVWIWKGYGRVTDIDTDTSMSPTYKVLAWPWEAAWGLNHLPWDNWLNHSFSWATAGMMDIFSYSYTGFFGCHWPWSLIVLFSMEPLYFIIMHMGSDVHVIHLSSSQPLLQRVREQSSTQASSPVIRTTPWHKIIASVSESYIHTALLFLTFIFYLST